MDTGEPLGCVAFGDGDDLVLGRRSGVAVASGWGADPALWVPLEPDRPTQCNDGRADPDGGFVVGTADPARTTKGALYRIAPSGTATVLLEGTGMSNGLDWSPDGRWMYFADSLAGTVTRYAWDGTTGSLGEATTLVTIDDGYPDGLTVDREGAVWLAVWGAGQVRRYRPDGRLTAVVDVPTPNVTSCTLGGLTLNDLFITTGADDPAAGGTDAAGDVYKVAVAVPGRPAFRVTTAGRGHA